MQQLFVNAFTFKWYFAFGAPQKTSLSIQYCRENGFQHFANPTIEQLKNCKTNAIIQGSYQLFLQVQKIKPDLLVIFFGTNIQNQNEKKLRKQYQSIGFCKDVPLLDYPSCRKALYPNLIFFYGPLQEQNLAASTTMSNNISYIYSELPPDPNDLIKFTDKTKNYVVNGLFTDPKSIKILDEYFNIRIIHFKHKREDQPKHSSFFDSQFNLIPFLKDKKYYYGIKGNDDPVLIMDNVCISLSPKLVFINYNKNDKKDVEYVQKYIDDTDGILLSIFDMQHLRKKKNLHIPKDLSDKIKLIDSIVYKDLNKKQILFTDFPWQTFQFTTYEGVNRKFSHFVDLNKPEKYIYDSKYSSSMYFLQNQARINPSQEISLKQELSDKISYWVVNGPGTCGKTSIAKYIASQFGYKLIQFQAEAAAAKQKIASPDDGDEVPVRKYIAYFANLIKSNPQTTYIFDALPYNNADLQLWIKQVGSPNVINLKAQALQLIKRTRKKAQGDVNAEVTQQDTAKANESLAKNNQWIQKLGEYGPSSVIYQVDYSMPQILAEPLFNSILRPRIFLVQRNNHLVYQNLAIRYNMGFVNLGMNSLRQCAPIVKKCGKRDVILCYYQHDHENLVSQDLYWIEKNLGEIRYLGIWQPEQKQIHERKMKLQRPPAPEKPKPAQGQEAKQEAPPEAEEQGKAKKAFDIYQYQWSEPISYKNLSQWYFKLKKDVRERKNDPKQCYNKFQQVLNTLNNDKNSNFYEIIVNEVKVPNKK